MPIPRINRWEAILRHSFTLLSLWAVYDFWRHNDRVSLASAILCVLLLQLALPLQKLIRFRLPPSWRLIYLGFIICSMYLGEIHGFFYRFLWWDDFLHTCSAMMISYVGLLLFRLIYARPLKPGALPPLLVALWVFSFTLAFGALWELFEFGADQLFGVNMLKGRDSTLPGSIYDYGRALINTMQDLMLDATGALLVALGTWFHLARKGVFSRAFGSLIEQFLQENGKTPAQD